MKVEFWGVRGSIPSSHRGTVRYGGNTACVEVRTRSNDLIILDSGTGIRRLGVKIMKETDAAEQLEGRVEFMVEEMARDIERQIAEGIQTLEGARPYKKEMHLFLSHNHWDHIQGFPFFIPAYVPGFKIHIYSLLKADHRLRDIFTGQMGHTYFPVMLEQMQAELVFHEITEETIKIGDTTITSRHLNHPQGCLGFRIASGEMSVAYCTDNEQPDGGLNPNVLELAEFSDMFIFDSQYTPEEYAIKKGWGHSTWVQGTEIARLADVKKYIMFHHDPEHDDEFIDDMLAKARERFPHTFAAYENMSILDYPFAPTMFPEDDRAREAAAVAPPALEHNNGTALVNPGATLRNLSDPAFRARLGSALSNGTRALQVDCSGVRFNSTAGLVELGDLAREVRRARGIRIVLSRPGPELERRLRISRFDRVAEIRKE